MPNRQYYCWKLHLKYSCGCSSSAATQHVCNENRGIYCHRWMITRSTNKSCESHRAAGLHGESEEEERIQDDWTELLDDDDQEEQPQAQSQGALSQANANDYPYSGLWEQTPKRRAD
ncbi:hypothetical protein OQA88_11918 [Cercophora sp. LCS_1]